MQNIQQIAEQTFKSNLIYLGKKHSALLKKINILNDAIQNGLYKENYALEYKGGYFDVLDINKSHFLYAQNSIEHAKVLTKEVNFKKSDNTLKSFNHNVIIRDEDLKPQRSIDSPLFAAAKIIDYTQRTTSQDDEMKFITKYIFCGLGLGVHLDPIQAKTKSTMLFLYEDNLELFRLSLFVTNYQTLSLKSELFFSIGEKEKERREIFEQFFTKGFNNNHYIKYSVFSHAYIEKIKQIKSLILFNEHLAYQYSKRLKTALKAPEYLVIQKPFLDFSHIHKNTPLFNKPVLIVASGPSLDRNALWLQKNREKFIIISVLSSIKKLYKLDIEPDIVAHIDEQSMSVNLFDGIDTKNLYHNTLFIFGSVVSSNVVESFKKENIFFFDQKGGFKREFGNISAASIGEVVYAISLLLGANQLYLLGLDLAIDPETNRSHTTEHTFNKIVNTDDNVHDMHLHKSAIPIKGNFLPIVNTTPAFIASILAFDGISNKYLINNQKVYNLSNGALLNKTTPLYIDKVNVETFQEIKQQDRFEFLKTLLFHISQIGLSQKDREFLLLEIHEAKELQKAILKFKTASQKNSYEGYMINFNILFSSISASKSAIIKDILFSYFVFISSYIFDLFNTKELKNSKRHLKKIDELFVEELIKLTDIYIKTMEVYKEWEEKYRTNP